MCLFSASVTNLSFDILHWCVQPQPLALLEEDIREVLKEETGADIFTQVQNQLQYRSYEVLATCLHTCFHSHANGFSINIQKVSSFIIFKLCHLVFTADGSSCKESEKVSSIGQLGKRLFECTAVSPTAD